MSGSNARLLVEREKMKKYGYTKAEMLDKKTLERSLEIAKFVAKSNPTWENLEEVAQLEKIIKKLK